MNCTSKERMKNEVCYKECVKSFLKPCVCTVTLRRIFSELFPSKHHTPTVNIIKRNSHHFNS